MLRPLAMPKEMSWLSPKRRRTTGNLKTVPNGQVNSVAQNGSVPQSPVAVRPPSTHRPFSQPDASSVGSDGDGNLFYAYAQKGDDLRSRYLLTFASAAVANEWWLLLQTNFPDTSRPGPQLFSFQTDDLLTKIWRHPSFSHLKSKWMYISFSDTSSDGIGGAAAQSIIPVQDAQGNMLGGSSGDSGPDFATQVRKEAREVKTEVQKMEEFFEKMMAAVQQNTDKVAQLMAKREESASDMKRVRSFSEGSTKSETGSVVDMGVLSGHFVRMNDLLSKNSQHVENLTKKHYDDEQKLRQSVESLASQKKNDYLDMQQLSHHLDRIQTMMESSIKERKDSAREISEFQSRPTHIDFSPLTERLEKVQEAVEQNSGLIKALLDEGGAGSDSKAGTPFWGKNEPTQPDLTPLAQHLERIYGAIEKQSEHMKALVGFASANNQEGEDSAAAQPAVSLDPLNEHLEQIFNAIEEGNKRALEAPKFDLRPLDGHLKALREHSKTTNDHIRQLLNSQEAATEATQANRIEIDFAPLTEHLQALREHSKTTNDHMRQILESKDAAKDAMAGRSDVDLSPLTEHLQALREHSEKNNDHMQRILESQNATRAAVQSNKNELDLTPMTGYLQALRDDFEKSHSHMERLLGSQDATREAVQASGNQMNLAPVTEHLQALRDHSEKTNGHMERLLESQDATREAVQSNKSDLDLTPMTEHLQALRDRLDTNNDHMQQLLESQNATRDAIEANGGEIDFTPMAEHLEVLREQFEKNNDHMQQMIESQNATREAIEANGGEIDFTPMAEHLEAIRESSNTNAETIKALLESQEATRREDSVDFTPLKEHLDAVRTATESSAKQIRRLVASQQSSAKSEQSAPPDFTPLTERLNRIHTTLEKQAERNEQNQGIGDAKFLMNALTSHLSKIQGITEQNAQHVKSLREKQSSSSDKMGTAVSETSEQVRSLIERNQENETRIEAQNSQMRELMSGQREMVEVMRQLAKNIAAQNKGSCDHIVVPPPRKMGRKIVGFVYDAKEGTP